MQSGRQCSGLNSIHPLDRHCRRVDRFSCCQIWCSYEVAPILTPPDLQVSVKLLDLHLEALQHSRGIRLQDPLDEDSCSR